MLLVQIRKFLLVILIIGRAAFQRMKAGSLTGWVMAVL